MFKNCWGILSSQATIVTTIKNTLDLKDPKKEGSSKFYISDIGKLIN